MKKEIRFSRVYQSQYSKRTLHNVLNSDITLAFAADFESAGEKYTRDCCSRQGKPYLGIMLDRPLTPERITKIVEKLNTVEGESITINIAGNSLSTLLNKDANWDQWGLNLLMTKILLEIKGHPDFKKEISLIRSGGQTGVDEAGIFAGYHLELFTEVTSTYDWKFRMNSGKDVSDELSFKKRFNY